MLEDSAGAVAACASERGPDVIVLGLNVTGLAVVRALAENDINVYGASLSPSEPGRASRRCKVVDLEDVARDSEKIIEWLCEFAEKRSGRPVVFPVSDEVALLMARHHERLAPVVRLWNNSDEQLQTIVDKHKLYECASRAGLPVPPGLVSPDRNLLIEWCAANQGPYLVKPFYFGLSGTFGFKNKTFANADDLLAFFKQRDFDASGLIVQRILQGGDGRIFDCYGLCDAEGRVKVLASHRRIRQYPPDFGITCLGEIPAMPRSCEARLFELTRALLSSVKYHGIFGIEWLLDRDSNEYYLLDFNARPFYTIGHLHDCGVNLPLLAYRDLCGDQLAGQPETPELKHLYWLDFWPFASTYSRLRGTGRMSWKDLSSALIRCRSHALWELADPGPGYRRTVQALSMLTDKIKKRG